MLQSTGRARVYERVCAVLPGARGSQRGAAVGGQVEGEIPTIEFDAFFARHERPLFAYLRRLLPSDDVDSLFLVRA
jgi:hypothetical protein